MTQLPSGLVLPTGVRGAAGALGLAGAEQGRREQLPNGALVQQRAVDMGRQGWRHEVAATWQERDQGEPVQRTDVLWLASIYDADKLRRAAADELRAGTFSAGGLSSIVRRLGIALPRN